MDRLRDSGDVVVSQLAEVDGRPEGHALFVRVRVGDLEGVGLAPLAVHPEAQGRRIGAAVATAGLDACRVLDEPFAVVLGDPAYYERLGFASAHRFGLRCAWQVPDGVFRVQRLATASLQDVRGLARYPDIFSTL